MNLQLQDRKTTEDFVSDEKPKTGSDNDFINNTTGRKKAAAPLHNLNDFAHQKHIVKRQLPENWVRANCRSATKEEAADWLYNNKKLAEYVKYAGVIMEGANGQGQYRPHKEYKPISAEKSGKGKALKYHTRPNEAYDVMLPIHPDDKYFWDFPEEIKQNYCYSINGKPYLLLTEGLFKAIAGTSNGFATVALKGVTMGLTPKKDDPQGRKYLVDGLLRLCQDFGFIISFDADLETNKNVKAALYELGFHLSKQTDVMVCGSWDEKDGKGMDDFIKNKGIEEFRKYLSKSVTFKKWGEQYKDEKAQEKAEKEWGTQGSIVDALIEVNRPTLKYHAKHKEWYQYEAELKGVWSPVTDEEVMSLCYKECRHQKDKFATHSLTTAVRNTLKHELRESSWVINPDYICLEDCVVNIHTLKSSPHSPGYKFLTQRPFKWADRGNGITPIEDFLLFANWGHQDRVQLFRAAFKATVTARGGAGGVQRFIEMIGSGGSGKGTILTLLTELVGKEGTVITDFTQLQNNRFETSNLYGKLAVIISDAEQYSGDMSTFKAMTGGDNLRNEKKGIQQGESFPFLGLAWVAANSATASKEYTSGLYRRRIPVPMTRSVKPEDQRDLKTEFKPHLASFLEWVLQMPDDEMMAYLNNTAKMVPSLSEFASENLVATNPFAAWFQECVIYSPEVVSYVGNKNQSPEEYLYPNYCCWAESQGYKPVSLRKFSETVVDLVKNQLRLSDTIAKTKDRKGAYITELMLRPPGDRSTPLPFGDEVKSATEVMNELSLSGASNNDCQGCDGNVMDKKEIMTNSVMAQAPASDGCDGSNRDFQSKKISQSVVSHSVTTSSQDISGMENSYNPSHSSQASNTNTNSHDVIHDCDELEPSESITLTSEPNFQIGDRVFVKESHSKKIYQVVKVDGCHYMIKEEESQETGKTKGKSRGVLPSQLILVTDACPRIRRSGRS